MPSARLKKSTVEARGETFQIREWTAAERAEFLKRSRDDALSAQIYIAHRCTLKEDGKPVWPKESDAGDEPSDLMDVIVTAVCKLSGLDPEAESSKNG